MKAPEKFERYVLPSRSVVRVTGTKVDDTDPSCTSAVRQWLVTCVYESPNSGQHLAVRMDWFNRCAMIVGAA